MEINFRIITLMERVWGEVKGKGGRRGRISATLGGLVRGLRGEHHGEGALGGGGEDDGGAALGHRTGDAQNVLMNTQSTAKDDKQNRFQLSGPLA